MISQDQETTRSPPTEQPNVRLGRYVHYKNLPYRVLGTVRHSETLETMVLYQALYVRDGAGQPQLLSEDEIARTPGERMWVRPAAMFAETVSVSGQIVPRFKYVSD